MCKSTSPHLGDEWKLCFADSYSVNTFWAPYLCALVKSFIRKQNKEAPLCVKRERKRERESAAQHLVFLHHRILFCLSFLFLFHVWGRSASLHHASSSLASNEQGRISRGHLSGWIFEQMCRGLSIESLRSPGFSVRLWESNRERREKENWRGRKWEIKNGER